MRIIFAVGALVLFAILLIGTLFDHTFSLKVHGAFLYGGFVGLAGAMVPWEPIFIRYSGH